MVRFWTSQLNLLIADKNARCGSGATLSGSVWRQIESLSQSAGSKKIFRPTLTQTEWRRIHTWHSYQQSISLIEIFKNGPLVDFHCNSDSQLFLVDLGFCSRSNWNCRNFFNWIRLWNKISFEFDFEYHKIEKMCLQDDWKCFLDSSAEHLNESWSS